MTYVRHYVMRAKPDGADAMTAALTALQSAVVALPGSLGVALMQDQDEPERFVFVERWTDQAAHKAAGASLPGDVMAQVKDALGAPPEGSSLDELVA